MKKYMLSAICIVAVAVMLHASYDSDRIGQKLSNAAPRAFGSFRMFEDPVNQTGVAEWNAAVNEGLDLFSQANKKSTKAQTYIAKISNANNDLVNSIKGVYNVVFLPAVGLDKIPADNMQASWNYKQQAVAVFERIQNQMAALIAEVKSNNVKLEEKDIILELAGYISSYAQNAVASIDFKFTTENKFKASIPQDRPWIRVR